jgi:hypothetical protein
MTTLTNKFAIEARPMHNQVTVYVIIELHQTIENGIKVNRNEDTGFEFTDENRAKSKMALLELLNK